MNFKVSKDWIARNTNEGSLNKRQARILDVAWPLTTGWIRRAEGKVITGSQKKAFEIARKRKPAEQTHLFPQAEEKREEKRQLWKCTGEMREGICTCTEPIDPSDPPPWDP